jgi:Amt family ammonium transporter
VFVAFQATFAAITCALIVGAFAERIKFSAVLLFSVLWFTFSYLPMAHMVWYWDGPDADHRRSLVEAVTANAGWLWAKGALDFAGGTVVHINAGVAGLVGAYVVGKRIGYGKESMAPHSLTLTMVGASLLWVGWFGFNAGSNLEANGLAGLAFINTLLATAPPRCPGCRCRVADPRASPRCWARPPARWPAWWPSPRPAASSARWAPSSSACSPAWSACGA